MLWNIKRVHVIITVFEKHLKGENNQQEKATQKEQI